MSSRGVVIVGAGHGGVQAAASLREDGYLEPITLISNEREWPYQRPPLSKAFLKGEMDLSGLPLRGEPFYADNAIDLQRGEAVLSVDRARKRVTLTNGGEVLYDHLILSTGARNRMPKADGLERQGVHFLRTIADAAVIRAGLETAQRIVIVGAGFIGLEIAATARGLKKSTTIVEIAERPMGRAVSPQMSQFFRAAHEAFGAEFRFGVGLEAIDGPGNVVGEVALSDGSVLPADLVVVGVGILAEDRLAAAAGLACANGVVVDARLATSDSAISAIGDCAAFPNPFGDGLIRLESVQNAVDQARAVARRLAGRGAPYAALPWFWSDQGDLKLQIAGLAIGVDEWVERGDSRSRAFSTVGFRAGKAIVVESVNRPADHMAARRILGARLTMTPNEAVDPNFDLRKLALSAPR